MAEVFAASSLTPLVCDRDTPTPVLSFAIRRRKAIGGINITASHNPPEYSGFKFSRHDGAGAPPEATKPIEETIARLQRENWTFPAAIIGTFSCKSIDPQAEYFRHVRRLADFSAIKKARLKVAVDLIHGCGRGYLDTLLREAGARLTVFHGDLNPLFGGHPPEPSAEHLRRTAQIRPRRPRPAELRHPTAMPTVLAWSMPTATWITPNQVLALTLYHLGQASRVGKARRCGQW